MQHAEVGGWWWESPVLHRTAGAGDGDEAGRGLGRAHRSRDGHR